MIDIGVLDVTDAKFWPGKLYFTAAADREIPREDIVIAVKRHIRGDWGDVCNEDYQANEEALAEGGRLLSVYQDVSGVRFWIITDADRSKTNVELHISFVMLSLQKC